MKEFIINYRIESMNPSDAPFAIICHANNISDARTQFLESRESMNFLSNNPKVDIVSISYCLDIDS